MTTFLIGVDLQRNCSLTHPGPSTCLTLNINWLYQYILIDLKTFQPLFCSIPTYLTKLQMEILGPSLNELLKFINIRQGDKSLG